MGIELDEIKISSRKMNEEIDVQGTLGFGCPGGYGVICGVYCGQIGALCGMECYG